MLRLIDSRLLRLLSLFILLFGVRSYAQFEVSPDHVDSARPNPAAKKRALTKTGTSKTAPTPAAAASPATTQRKRASHKKGHGTSTQPATGSQATAALRPR